MNATEQFHAHLDGCSQCRTQPFNLCATGQHLLPEGWRVVTFMQIRPAVCCWVCHAREQAGQLQVPSDWLPEGWRRVRRGYAGRVTICMACTTQGRHYRGS